MASQKVTFTFDEGTVARIDRTAQRLGLSKSRVVREAIREYAERVGRLSEGERLRMLGVFDELVERIPERPLEAVEREIADVRRARQGGGRRTEPNPS
jgi:metal-responsive CopG/Arc/MetJ family transcriptional regulator